MMGFDWGLGIGLIQRTTVQFFSFSLRGRSGNGDMQTSFARLTGLGLLGPCPLPMMVKSIYLTAAGVSL